MQERKEATTTLVGTRCVACPHFIDSEPPRFFPPDYVFVLLIRLFLDVTFAPLPCSHFQSFARHRELRFVVVHTFLQLSGYLLHTAPLVLGLRLFGFADL